MYLTLLDGTKECIATFLRITQQDVCVFLKKDWVLHTSVAGAS